MKGLLTFIFSSLMLVSFGQWRDTYKNYKIVWDSTTKVHFVLDTLTKKRIEVDYPYLHGLYFHQGFIYIRTGDMKGLMNLEGKKLLAPSHFINFNEKDSLISAYICDFAGWIFMNYRGDTLSIGHTKHNNYVPTLDKELNLAWKISGSGILWGYLDKKAKWKIKPQFQRAKDFEKGFAEVKLNDVWVKIDTVGNIVDSLPIDTSDH